MENRKPEASPSLEGIIHWRIDQWFKFLPANALLSLKKFHELLLKYNDKLSLISAKTVFHADNIHFADSILANEIVFKDQQISEIYDFGAGNGFPSLIFAILNPNVKIKAVEVDQRKCEFMKIAKAAVGATNFEVLNVQVESLPNDSVKVAVSRAFAPLSKALLLTRRPFAAGGTYYHMKSEEWSNEVSELPTQLCTFWTPSLVGEYKLPAGEIKYAVVKTVKNPD